MILVLHPPAAGVRDNRGVWARSTSANRARSRALRIPRLKADCNGYRASDVWREPHYYTAVALSVPGVTDASIVALGPWCLDLHWTHDMWSDRESVAAEVGRELADAVPAGVWLTVDPPVPGFP